MLLSCCFDALHKMIVSLVHRDECIKHENLSGPTDSINFFDMERSNMQCRVSTTIINRKGEWITLLQTSLVRDPFTQQIG